MFIWSFIFTLGRVPISWRFLFGEAATIVQSSKFRECTCWLSIPSSGSEKGYTVVNMVIDQSYGTTIRRYSPLFVAICTYSVLLLSTSIPEDGHLGLLKTPAVCHHRTPSKVHALFASWVLYAGCINFMRTSAVLGAVHAENYLHHVYLISSILVNCALRYLACSPFRLCASSLILASVVLLPVVAACFCVWMCAVLRFHMWVLCSWFCLIFGGPAGVDMS